MLLQNSCWCCWCCWCCCRIAVGAVGAVAEQLSCWCCCRTAVGAVGAVGAVADQLLVLLVLLQNSFVVGAVGAVAEQLWHPAWLDNRNRNSHAAEQKERRQSYQKWLAHVKFVFICICSWSTSALPPENKLDANFLVMGFYWEQSPCTVIGIAQLLLNNQRAQGLQGLQGWPTARDSGWWQLAGETKSTSVKNWYLIWHKLEESVWVLIQECNNQRVVLNNQRVVQQP